MSLDSDSSNTVLVIAAVCPNLNENFILPAAVVHRLRQSCNNSLRSDQTCTLECNTIINDCLQVDGEPISQETEILTVVRSETDLITFVQDGDERKTDTLRIFECGFPPVEDGVKRKI